MEWVVRRWYCCCGLFLLDLALQRVGNSLAWVIPAVGLVERGLDRMLLVPLLGVVEGRLMDCMDGSVLGFFRRDR